LDVLSQHEIDILEFAFSLSGVFTLTVPILALKQRDQTNA